MLRLLPLLPLLIATTATTASADQPELVPGDVIVHWKTPAHLSSLDQVAGRRVLRGRAVTSSTWVYHLEERTHAATAAALAELKLRPGVLLVEPNLVRRPFLVPNDTHYALQWYAKTINLEAAWQRTTGTSSVVVAIVDTGSLPHPDLDGRMVQGYDFISDATSAGDGGGRDADPTDMGSADLKSSALHGLHVMGVVGAAGNNAKGVAGVNWACKLLPVRALGINGGKGTDADIAAAIRWAAGLPVPGAPTNQNPARVINLSFGGTGAATVLSQAVADAQAAGAILVAAAGNQGGSASDIHPAALPGVIAVGATGWDGKRASYSNYGPAVDLMAPGGSLADTLPFPHQGKNWPAGILSTLRTTDGLWGYHLYEGTSQAAPLVAGTVSLMLALEPQLTPAQATNLLAASANPAARCTEGCGAGLLDVGAALEKTKPPPPPPPTSTPAPTPGTLSFGSPCQGDQQCSEGVCRNVSATQRLCTRFCKLSEHCPSGATCQNDLCVAGSSALVQSGACPGASDCLTPATNLTIQGGCAISGRPDRSLWLLLLLMAGGLAARRRAGRRRR